jgi:sporulation protein YlmC with PRC-barrel domain
MTEASQQFTIGSDVSCSDGPCGTVQSVVIDPVARSVSHLVIEPTHRSGLGRLVPLDLVDTTSGDIRLHCTRSDFDGLELAEERHFLPGFSHGLGTYTPGEVFSLPYYGLGGGTLRGGVGVGAVSQFVVSDSVPLGEVAVHRGDPVHATDAAVGRVQGLVIDPGSRHVTHVLLQEGHLWGRKDVVIPIRAVTEIDQEGIHLDLSKADVAALPPVDIQHPDVSS